MHELSSRGLGNLMILIIPRVHSSAETLQLSVDKEITLNRTNNSNPTRWLSNGDNKHHQGAVGSGTSCWLDGSMELGVDK